MVVSSSPLPAVGSLVSARGRDWVVLPPDEPLVIRLRPLTGTDDDITGLFVPLEGVPPAATFAPPDPGLAGDAAGGRLVRDAARLSLRASAAPFRSLGRISVTPRPYQFVPLIMALRKERVRLLIADDVGVGKTVEAALVARELLDRGLAKRLAVLCPAHLCDQWQRELWEKVGIAAEVVQPSSVGRLERGLPRQDLSLFQYYPHLIFSIDFVKSDRTRGRFLDNAADLVIVDEAHSAARPRGDGGASQHQRFALLHDLAEDPSRHLVLVTATPHSGIEESFRSLLGLLDPAFDIPEAGGTAELERRQLLPHVVQRRRRDLVHWLGTETPFPERQSSERAYTLAGDYHALFNDVLAYCRETVAGGAGLRQQQQRVRHWAAIALLRCVLSSPAAAEAVLGNRAKGQGLQLEEATEAAEDPDALYRPQVMDTAGDDEQEQPADYTPAAPLEDAQPLLSDSEKRRLSGFLRRAQALKGASADRKLAEAGKAVGELLRDGYSPIVFCRFISTAKYVAEELGKLLPREVPGVAVKAVTGELGDEQRREAVDELVRESRRVLVATDCLSEGINLQERFDAVVHYDLPWNPNRLEQREGRVDRFGQPRGDVRVVLLNGADNPVDQVVLEVLIRKARLIRQQLGVAVPVPGESEQVVQAVVESVLLRGGTPRAAQLQLGFTEPEVQGMLARWDRAAEQEGQQRTYFAQQGIRPDEVQRELAACDPVLGDADAVVRFLGDAAQRFGGELRPAGKPGVFELHPGDLRATLQARGFEGSPLRLTTDPLLDPAAIVVGRTHPIVAALCDAVLGAALGTDGDGRFPRCGATVTDAVDLRTVVLLLRLRYQLRERVEEFAEEVLLAAFQRREGKLVWLEPLDRAGTELMERVRPQANLAPEERQRQVTWALDFLKEQPDWYEPVVQARVQALQDAHDRLRKLVRAARLDVLPHRPPDILGCYVLVPAGGAPGAQPRGHGEAYKGTR